MKRVYKYQLGMRGTSQIIDMPAGAELLAVQVQHDVPCIWALVNLDNPMTQREFLIVGTGHNLPERYGGHVGTFQLDGGSFVFHVFECSRL
jgi:hypothetical protein